MYRLPGSTMLMVLDPAKSRSRQSAMNLQGTKHGSAGFDLQIYILYILYFGRRNRYRNKSLVSNISVKRYSRKKSIKYIHSIQVSTIAKQRR